MVSHSQINVPLSYPTVRNGILTISDLRDYGNTRQKQDNLCVYDRPFATILSSVLRSLCACNQIQASIYFTSHLRSTSMTFISENDAVEV
jgi:hypothetical protein